MRFRTGLFATLMASIVLAATYVPTVNAANEIKRLVPFQGRLHGTDSKVVTDGHYDLTFYIYDTPTGGTALWTEAHPKVSVIHGYINVLLGATTAMDEASYATGDPNYDSSKSLVDFTKQKFLGISINGGAEMFPRSQLVPSFHAYTANHAEHATEADHAKNSDSLGNIVADAYVTEAELSGFSSGVLHSTGSLGELADKAASRTNLDVHSKAEASAQMLDASSNLSDVTNSASARANLNVYSKSEGDGMYLNVESLVTARENLEVYSKSESEGLFSTMTASNSQKLGNVESSLFARLDKNADFSQDIYESGKRVFSESSIQTLEIGAKQSVGWIYLRRYPDGFTEGWAFASAVESVLVTVILPVSFTSQGLTISQLSDVANVPTTGGNVDGLTSKWATSNTIQVYSEYNGTHRAALYFVGWTDSL